MGNDNYIRHGKPGQMSAEFAKMTNGLLGKVLTVARVLGSPRVPEAVFHTRMSHCHECPHCAIKMRGNQAEHYCVVCGCREWRGSKMEVKNRHAANLCPADPQRFRQWKG